MSLAQRGPTGQKWCPEVRDIFLEELRRTGHIYHACRVAGVSYRTMKRYRAGGELADPEFEESYEQAMGDYIGMLKSEAQKRAVEGWVERPVVDKDGNVVGEVRKFSDALLITLLKRSDDGYKERVSVDAKTEHSGAIHHNHDVDLEKAYQAMNPEEREALKTTLRALARPAPGEESPEPVH